MYMTVLYIRRAPHCFYSLTLSLRLLLLLLVHVPELRVERLQASTQPPTLGGWCRVWRARVVAPRGSRFGGGGEAVGAAVASWTAREAALGSRARHRDAARGLLLLRIRQALTPRHRATAQAGSALLIGLSKRLARRVQVGEGGEGAHPRAEGAHHERLAR